MPRKLSRSECALGVERPSALRGALTRKAIEAKLSGGGDIVIWGDGTQSRSFMYIDDCVDGTQRIMHSGITDPINLGSDELVTINELVDVIEKAAGVDLERAYDRTKPQGVDGRSLKLLPPSGRGATRTTRRSWTSWAGRRQLPSEMGWR